MSDKPRRRFHVTIELGADDRPALTAALREIYLAVRDGYHAPIVSGGVASGWLLQWDEDPAMTHERYVAALKAHLAKESTDGPQVPVPAAR